MNSMWEGAGAYYFEPFCRGPGCTNTSLIAHGLCWRHYQQVRRTGRLLPYQSADLPPPPCRAPWCGRPAVSKQGYCRRHHRQLRQHGRLLGEHEQHTPKNEGRSCLAPGCARSAWRYDEYCREHRGQLIRQGQLASDRRLAPQRWTCRRVTAADRRQMVTLRRQGKRQYDIVEATGFGLTTVFRELQRAGLTKTGKKRIMEPAPGHDPGTSGLQGRCSTS